MSLALVATGGSSASAPRLDFLGVTGSAASGQPLGEQDARLLFALRQPATLDEILDKGIPFDSSRVVELVKWGVLEQNGTRFHATIPILVAEEAEAFRARVRAHVPSIVDELVPVLESLSATISTEIGELAVPAVVTWILRERAWYHVVAQGAVPIADRVRSQRAEYPDRGWWGVFWHIDPPVRRAHELTSLRARERMLRLAWPRGQAPAEFDGNRGRALAARFLALIDGDGRRLDDGAAFEELVALGMVAPDGTLPARMREWEPDEDGSAAAAVETAARAVASEVAASLAAANFDPTAGDPVALAALAYMELVPEILETLDREGMKVLLASEPGAGDSGPSSVAGRAANGDGPRQPVPLSFVAWDEYAAPESAFPLPW